jgi:hypothetical protein
VIVAFLGLIGGRLFTNFLLLEIIFSNAILGIVLRTLLIACACSEEARTSAQPKKASRRQGTEGG